MFVEVKALGDWWYKKFVMLVLYWDVGGVKWVGR
jgi:hypothetical protein